MRAVCASERWAGLLGRSQDEACLHAEAESIRAAFRKHFYDKQKNRVAGDCQSSTAMMLYYGFAEQDEIPGLVQRLSELIDAQNGHLDFGVLGMKSVLNVLGQYGLVKKALQMIGAPVIPAIVIGWIRRQQRFGNAGMGTVRIATTCSQTFRPFSTNTLAVSFRWRRDTGKFFFARRSIVGLQKWSAGSKQFWARWNAAI